MATTDLDFINNLTKINKNMAQVKFYRGLKAKYVADGAHLNGVYFATDTKELLMNGQAYGLSVTDAATLAGSVKSIAIGTNNTITVTKNDNSTSTISLALSIAEDTTKKDADATLEAGKQYELTVGKESIVIAMPEKDDAKADQVLSNDETTNSHLYGGSQKINLSGVTSNTGSSATVVMPNAQTISSSYIEGKNAVEFGASNQVITISDATADNTVSIELPALNATADAGDSLISASMTNGVIDVDVELAESTKAATAIATKEYVDEKAEKEATTYSFGSDVKFAKSTKERAGANDYDVTIKLNKKVGNEAVVEADNVVVTLDTTDFIKDGILDNVVLAEKAEDIPSDIEYSGEYPALVFTFVTGIDAEKKPIVVPVKKLVDVYTAGDGLQKNASDDHKFEVKAKEGGYISVTADGVDVASSMIKLGEETGADAKLATVGYVDEVAQNSSVKVSLTGADTTVEGETTSTATINNFGDSASINIKTGADDAEGTTFAVSLPGFTAGTSTSTNVGVSIANTGVITVTSTEQGVAESDKETYSNTKLAQAAYVDKQIADAKAAQTYTAGDGINDIATDSDTKNQISVKAGSYVTVDGNGVSVDSSKIQGYAETEATAGDNNIASKKYVDDTVSAALIWNEVE